MPDLSNLLQPDRGQSARTIHLVDAKGFDAWLSAQPPRARAAAEAQKLRPTGYASAILPLEKQLRSKPEILRAVGAGLSNIQEHQSLHELSVTSEEVVDRLSGLYERTLGTVEPRIRVMGQQKHLQNQTNPRRFRALLMAGIVLFSGLIYIYTGVKVTSGTPLTVLMFLVPLGGASWILGWILLAVGFCRGPAVNSKLD